MTNQQRLDNLKKAEELIREVEFSYPEGNEIRQRLYRFVVESFSHIGALRTIMFKLEQTIRNKNSVKVPASTAEVRAFQGSSDDLPEESDAYYAVRAYETHGDALRDNAFSELVAIGKRVEREGASND